MNGRRARGLFLGVLLATAALLTLSKGVQDWLNHDEHQFAMPGVLLLENGLLPYGDYPHFHVPYLSLLQGFVAHFFAYKLLAIRLVMIAFVWGGMATLVLIAGRMLRGAHPWVRTGFQAALVIGFLAARVEQYTAKYAWNHAPPTTLALFAFWLLLVSAESQRARTLVFLAGTCLSLATGMRISFLLLFAPFGLSLFLMPERSWRERLIQSGWFSFGAVLAALPFFWLLLRYPEQAVFDNFRYPKLAETWRQHPFWAKETAAVVDPQQGLLRSAEQFQDSPLSRKLTEFRTVTLRRHIPLAVAIVFLGIPLAVWGATRPGATRRFPALLLILTIPFVWWGCLLPTRFNTQYYYALLPWALLSLPIAAYCFQKKPQWQIVILVATLLAVGAQAMLTGARVLELGHLPDVKKWGPVAYHNTAQELRGFQVQGKVLTMEPLMAAEAGFQTYPEFANGEFAFRCAHILPAETRSRMKMVSAYDLESWLAPEPPAAILLDRSDKDLNIPFTTYAQSHGYRLAIENERIEFWIR